ncbi:MAG: site-specific integrase [Chloroflexi bacterium]|nr:site-specific integrase [Chloroflexota bacterium]
MTELRRRMIQDMELRALKENTKRAYLDAVKDLARHYGRSPDLLSEEELRRYFVNLTRTRRRSKSTLRVRLFGIKFLFKHTLRRPLPVFDLIRLPRDRKLPVVLSRQEVRQLLACIRRPEARMVALVMYSCGLRVTVASRLRDADIDSRRMMVCVRNGKGSKDQYVPLPQRTLELLRTYWREYRPGHWLFPDRSASQPIDRCTVLKCIKAAAQDAKITKPIGCHTLRHSYATHLLEDGVDLRTIQTLLGHRSIRSTVGYLHLTQQAMKNVHRSIDGLMADL